MTPLQQAGFCLLGWLLSYLVIGRILIVHSEKGKKEEGNVACGSCIGILVLWIAIYLLLPKT